MCFNDYYKNSKQTEIGISIINSLSFLLFSTYKQHAGPMVKSDLVNLLHYLYKTFKDISKTNYIVSRIRPRLSSDLFVLLPFSWYSCWRFNRINRMALMCILSLYNALQIVGSFPTSIFHQVSALACFARGEIFNNHFVKFITEFDSTVNKCGIAVNNWRNHSERKASSNWCQSVWNTSS